MFLICASGQQLTPSDQVDQVWHLHLLYTKSYWGEFCETIPGRKVHHMPTRGGQQESARFHDLYRQTLDIYQHFFGQATPGDIWPAAEPTVQTVRDVLAAEAIKLWTHFTFKYQPDFVSLKNTLH